MWYICITVNRQNVITVKNTMKIKEAIRTIKDVGLNVYTRKSKDSGFIKVYLKPVKELLPKISGNALKVLIALSYGLEWNEVEVIMTRENLAKSTGLSEATVRTALDELEKKLIIKRLGPNIRRSYVISNHYVRLGKND